MPRRDDSKLLVYDGARITHSQFRSLPDHLPGNAFLFFNDTKVIPARVHFTKESGATIEIFLLNPLQPSILLSETMASAQSCVWQCTIGNLKKWTGGIALRKPVGTDTLTAVLIDRDKGVVEFTWNSPATFAEIIRLAGETPLPPYIKRKAETSDAERYQTVYSHAEGAVAAPTAGLHFTPAAFSDLAKKNIGHDFLTLHVSAGTFQPIKAGNPDEHVMHEEQVIVSHKNLVNLLTPDRFIVAVGTTSMRTLESLYWFGAKLLADPDAQFRIHQNDPYTLSHPPSSADALAAVVRYLDRNGLDHLVGETSIFIRPGYQFGLCHGLITNFHQPASTLILLVAAFLGEDWRMVYDEALKNDYRFLSYGDSSLLIGDRWADGATRP